MQSTQTIPEQFANIFGLGGPQGVFAVSQMRRWGNAIFGLFLIGVAGLAVLYGFYDAYTQSAKYGPVMFTKALWPPLAIAAVAGVLSLLALGSAFSNWKRAVVLYEKGFAYSDNGGVQTWGWHEVDLLNVAITRHYTNGIYTGTTYLYTLQKSDGSRLVLDNKLQKIEQLGQAISRGVFPHQYQKLVAALNAGQTVTLGPVAVNKQGIAFGKKAYPWSEIEQVGIQNGYVNIKKKGGGWFSGASAAASSIANLDALLSVIDQVVGIKAG